MKYKETIIETERLILRRFQIEDAEEVSAMIAKTLRTTNIKDYSSEYIEKTIQSLQPQNLLKRSEWTHFYVVCDYDKIVGCGAIGPYWNKADESSFFTPLEITVTKKVEIIKFIMLNITKIHILEQASFLKN